MEAWRLGERAPGEVKLWRFAGRSFCFDNWPDRVGKRWLEEEEKQSLLSKGEAVSGAGGFGVFDRALCSSGGASRKRRFSCETQRGRMSRRAAGDARGPALSAGCHTCPTAQEGPRLVLANPLEGSAGPGLGSMKETALDSSRNSEFFLKTGLNGSCQRVQKGEAYPVAQFLLSLFDTGNGSRNSS